MYRVVHMLVVDTDESTRQTIEEAFEKKGYEVTGCASPNIARDIVSGQHGRNWVILFNLARRGKYASTLVRILTDLAPMPQVDLIIPVMAFPGDEDAQAIYELASMKIHQMSGPLTPEAIVDRVHALLAVPVTH